jgi:hypothetical protein
MTRYEPIASLALNITVYALAAGSLAMVLILVAL